MHGTSTRLIRLQATTVKSSTRTFRAGLLVRCHSCAATSNNSPAPASDDMSSWTTLPWQGNLKNMDTQPTLQELYSLLQAATASVCAYQQVNPRVQNLNKLANRIRRDLLFIETQEQLVAQQSNSVDPLEQHLQDGNSSPGGGLGEGQLQGIVNNLRGFHGELLAMHEAPGVMSVCQKVSSAPPRIWAPSCSISQQPALQSATQQPTTAAATAADNATALTTEHQEGRKLHSSQRGTRAQSAYRPADGSPSGVGEVIWSDTSCDPDSENSKHMRRQHNSNGTDTRRTRTYSLPQAADIGNSNGPVVPGLAAADAGAAGPLWVEVDVIANAGLTWIEVKNQERFGLESMHWLGCSGRCKGLAQQVADLKTVAAAPHNSRRWRAPEIIVFFPSGADEGVVAALRDMGITVAVGPGSLISLPVPRSPTTTNLDVTSLCALVSEVSWGDPTSQHMQQWASRTTHWQDCLAAQIASPLLPELQACLDNSQELVTSCAAVGQFQKLLDIFAGPIEQQRWQELQQRLQVYHWRTGKGIAAGTCVACGASLLVGCSDSIAAANEHLAANNAGTSDGLNGARDIQCDSRQKSGFDTLCFGYGRSGEQQQQQHMYAVSERVNRVDKLTKQQKAVLGLGDALEALTLTANGNAVRCCGHYGVKLEALVHRPVWLTGM